MSDLKPTTALLLPSPYSLDFIARLSEACAAAGRDISVEHGWVGAPAEGQWLQVIDSLGGDAVLPEDLSGWVVVAPANAAIALAAFLEQHRGMERAELLQILSRRYGLAGLLINRGARLITLPGEVNLPGLPTVTVTPGEGEPVREPSVLDYFDPLPQGVSTPVEWGPEVFSFTRGLVPEGGLPEMTLSGRGRILMHGPYLTLPEGKWCTRLRFEVDPEETVVELRFDWGQSERETSLVAEITVPGRYEVELESVMSGLEGMELRIWTCRGSLHGRLRMIGATVERLPLD